MILILDSHSKDNLNAPFKWKNGPNEIININRVCSLAFLFWLIKSQPGSHSVLSLYSFNGVNVFIISSNRSNPGQRSTEITFPFFLQMPSDYRVLSLTLTQLMIYLCFIIWFRNGMQIATFMDQITRQAQRHE